MTDQATQTLIERFEELEDKIRRAEDLPAEVAGENRRVHAAAAAAQQELRRFYTSGESNPKRERELVKALEEAETKADTTRWELRSEAAHTAPALARDELRQFVGEHFDEIAAELIPRSVEAYRALRAARLAYDEALAPYLGIRSTWDRLIQAGRGHIGVPMTRDELSLDDLRIPGQVTTPMPESLKPQAREWAAQNPATPKENGNGTSPQ